MNCRRLLVTVLFMLSAVPALAAPTKLAQQGRVLDGEGAPLEGSHDMVFVLYDADTDGTALWTEERDADFAAGYYSITLGEQVPLDDLLFTAESVWLELSIDGETLSPRQEVVSVPYALRATAAEHLEGGMVDAAEISVDGTVVIDASGNWVGPTPVVGWADLADIPADIADGDQDEDTLAGLACAEGQLPKWDAASSLWVCGDDIDTDTTDPNTDTLVSLACSTGQVAKWDGATWACGDDIDTDTTDPNTDTLQDLALTCFDGEIPSWDQSGGLWICIANTDTNTQLSNAQVAAAATAEGFVTGAHTVDTDTQLSDAQVAAAATAEGFVTGAHTVDTDTQLSNAQVAAAATAEGFVTGAHTVDTDTQLTESQVDTYVANNGYSTGPHTIDTNTQLTEAQVDAMVANNGFLSADAAGNVGIGTSTPTEKLTVDGTIESTSGGVKFPDGTVQGTAAAGGVTLAAFAGSLYTNTETAGTGQNGATALCNPGDVMVGGGCREGCKDIRNSYPVGTDGWFCDDDSTTAFCSETAYVRCLAIP